MNPDDTASLPPLLAQILAYVTLALTLTTVFAHGLLWLVPQLRVIASRTTTKRDDAVVDWLARAGASLSAFLDVVQILTPRIAMGKAAPPLLETSTRTVTVTETAPALPTVGPLGISGTPVPDDPSHPRLIPATRPPPPDA